MPYAFTQDDYRSFQDAILAAEGDQATLTSILADMQTTFTESMALVETTKQENAAIAAENERLKTTNMSLFQQIGEQAKRLNSGPQPIADDDEPEYKDVDSYMSSYFEKLEKRGK